MRNIPVFTGEFGAATLQEKPGRGRPTVVQWVQPGKTWEFLAECARFCRMAGARRVLASHLPEPRRLLLKSGCSVWPACGPACRRRTQRCGPSARKTEKNFCGFTTRGMSGVPAAMSLHQGDLPRLWTRGGYFVHRDGALLGIGQVNGDTLLSLVSCRRGGRARCGGGLSFR